LAGRARGVIQMSSLGSDAMADERRRGRPRIPEVQQRERLFDAAERLFVNGGEEGASVQAIVREARMSSRSFYEFFESKEDLVVELARERGDAFLAQLELAFRSAGDLSAALERLLHVYLERLPLVLVDLERLGGRGRARVREVRAGLRGRIQALLGHDLRQRQSRGEIGSVPSPTLLALVLAGLEELAVQSRRERDDGLAGAAEAELVGILRELLLSPVAARAKST